MRGVPSAIIVNAARVNPTIEAAAAIVRLENFRASLATGLDVTLAFISKWATLWELRAIDRQTDRVHID